MKNIANGPLENATDRLVDDINELAMDSIDANVFSEILNKRASALMTVVKAREVVTTFNDNLAKRNETTHYTRLEDLPPLHPDDEARLRDEFYSLAERVSQSQSP